MAKLLFMGLRGSADPTNAAMPFIMANGAKQAGHEPQIVLAKPFDVADLLGLVRDGLSDAVSSARSSASGSSSGRWLTAHLAASD